MRGDRSPVAPDQALLNAYLDQLKSQRKLATLTIVSYQRDLAELLNLLAADNARLSITASTHFQIRKFAAQLHAHGLNARSIARKLSAWRGFFAWLCEQNTIAHNPVDGIKPPKRSKPLPKALAADDAVRLVSYSQTSLAHSASADSAESVPAASASTTSSPTASSSAASAACNRAMFELLYSSGLRVSELAALDVRYVQESAYVSRSWIDLAAHEVMVTGKGSKVRSVPVGQAAVQAIDAWLAMRGSLIKNDTHPLFLNERGTRISVRSIQMRLKTHAQAAGLPVNVHPHMLRHSFASHVLQSSGDLRAVQEMLGHASISATQVYTSLDFQRLAQVYDAAHPRAKKKPQP
jgi:integrase/recombinase XerC